MNIKNYMSIFFSAIKNKPLLKDLANIAVPLFIANIINTSLQMIDQLMLSTLGTPTLAAIGIVNQFYFLFAVIFFGIASGAGIFFARLWKKEDIEQIKKIAVIVLYIELIFSIILLLITANYAGDIISYYTKDKEVIRIGTIFFTHVVYGQPFLALSCVYIYLFRICDHSKVATKGSIIAVVINTFLNYCFIYGNFGAPALGVAGAAISTIVARFVLFFYYLYQMNYKVKYFVLKLKDLFDIDWSLIKKIFGITLGLVVGDMLLVVSINVSTGIFTHFSTEVGAAYTINLMMRQFAMLTINAIVPAAMILIGYKIGATNDSDLRGVRILSLELQGICFYVSILMAAVILIFEPLVLFFGYQNISKTVVSYAFYMSSIMICFLPILNVNSIFTGAVFKSGGSTNFNLIVIFLSNVLISILGAFLVAKYTQNVLLTYLALFIGDTFRFVVNLFYFRFGKWLKVI